MTVSAKAVCRVGGRKTRKKQQCPLCKRRSSRTEPPRNIALKNLSEEGDLCALHGEKLKLHCLHDLETACLICHKHKYANQIPSCGRSCPDPQGNNSEMTKTPE